MTTTEQQRVNIVRTQTAQYTQNLRMALHAAGVPSKDLLKRLPRALTDRIMTQACEALGLDPAASNLRDHPWQRNKRFARKRGTTSEF